MNFKFRIHNPISLLFSLSIYSQIILTTNSFNISSIFISSSAINTQPPPLSPSSTLLKDVLKEIAVNRRWNLDEIRVLKIRGLRFAKSNKYEFRVGIGKSSLLFRFSDKVNLWKRVGKKKRSSNSKFRDLISEISEKRVLRKVRLDGPFELSVFGDDEMNLTLPLNTTHSGLKRLIVAEGITVILEGAREISLTHSPDFDFPITNKSMVINKKRNPYFPFRPSACTSLPPIQIVGSASLRAFNTLNPNVHIETSFLSPETIELLPVKLYEETFVKGQTCPITALNKKLDLLQKLMKILPEERISGIIKVNITTSILVQFELELERDVQDDDTFLGSLAEWRTKPVEGRVLYNVVALMEGERLIPIVVKKVRRVITADSMAWSTLMSNISFTKFPSVVGPPETLTLDVKW